MKTFTLVSALIAAVLATVPAPAPAGCTHTVTVGGLTPGATPGPKLVYQPEWIDAKVGDKVRFVFLQKNHTVTQSTFAEPCKKKDAGADSGFQPYVEGAAELSWDYTVLSEEATWFYCKQKTGNHCGKGMVFSINPQKTGEKTHESYKALAIRNYGMDPAPAVVQNQAPSEVPCDDKPSAVVVSPTGPAYHNQPPPTQDSTWSVVNGQGTDEQGKACSCSCMCGWNSFPSNVGQGNYGGWGGVMPNPY